MIYAELLSHIRQISVIAAVPPSSTTPLTAKFSSNRDFLRVSHDGQITTIRLPALVDPRFELPSPGPSSGNEEISWRLPLERVSSPHSDTEDAASAPWAASKLSETTQLACRKCGSVIVEHGRIQSWKDLPSENWAEMMDFWHCHKPHDHSNGSNGNASDNLTNRGYGANTKFTARPGVGFVDLTYFLISEEDSLGTKIIPSDPATTLQSARIDSIYCASCDASLGVFDHLAFGNRLYKWSLDVSTHDPNQTVTRDPSPPLSYFMTAHLLSQIAAQAVHHFILYSPSSASTPVLYIWVFMPKLTVSFSASGLSSSPPKPIPATKIFWQKIDKARMADLLDKGSLTIEEIKLPADVMNDLTQTLIKSNDSLPPSAKRFKEWDVGLLERFEPIQ